MSEAPPDLNLDPSATPPATETPPTPPAEPTSWRAVLPVEIRDNPSLARYKDVPALATGFLEAQEFVGKKGTIHPGENATPEQMDTYYNALGRPETVEGYELADFKPPEAIAELVDEADELA